MADEKDVAVVETSMANPKQAVNVINNITDVSAGTTPLETLQNNAPLFKQEENTEFFNSDAWADYKSNPFRAYNPDRYPGFAAIETTAANPAYTTIINRYGDAVARRAQAIHSTYAKANSWIGRVSDAYNKERYGLRAAAARKNLDNAIREGDEAKIARAKLKYQSELRKTYEEGRAFDDYGQTLMSLAASTARNPETLLVEAAGVGFAPVTGGYSLLAANAINAAIVGADTYKLETGGALEELDEQYPNMTEEEKFRKARPVGIINGAIEAGLFALGGNVAGRGIKTVGKEAAIKTVQRAVRRKTGEEITRDAAKDLIKTDFLKALQKPAKEATFKNTVAEFVKGSTVGGLGEGWQEVFQNSVTDAMLRSVKNGATLTEELLDDWADFIIDPFNEKHADKWETFINVAAASMVLGAGYSGVGSAIRNTDKLARQTTKHDGTGTIADKLTGAYNNSLGLSRLFEWHQDGDSKNAIGAANAALEEQIRRGEITGKLYTTPEQVEEMQQDPEVASALEQMGIARSLSEAEDNGGVVEIDLAEYDRVVNESQNSELFQKMRNYLSFSDTTMSLNEFNQFINSKGKELAQVLSDEVRSDEESVYNQLKNMALKAGRTAERAEGYAVLGHILLNNAQAFTKGEKNDILDRLTLTIDQGQGNITTQGFKKKENAYKGQNIQYKGRQLKAYNDVFTADGKQIRYAEYDSDYNTGVNREAIKGDTNIRVVRMSPQQFLNMTPKKMGDTNTSVLEEAIKNGNEIAMPFLDVAVADAEKKQLKIVGHEGRHRSLAMQNLGVENGYVILNSKDFYRQPELFADGLNGWTLLPQGEDATASGIELNGDARDLYVDVPVAAMVNATFTENPDADAQVYHMVVYAGSRTDYDEPSLTAIGSGEGNQSHGWGLYYALNRAVAEAYRENFISDNQGRWTYKGESLADLEDETESHVVFTMVHKEDYYGTKLADGLAERKEQLLGLYEEALEGRKEKLKEFKQELPSTSFMIKEQQEVVNRTKKQIKFLKQLDVNDIKFVENKGQVIEADIPEVNYLLDEQLPFDAQSSYVQKALKTMVKKENIQSEVLQNLDNNYSGHQIYRALSSSLRPKDASPLYVSKEGDELASKLLEKYGIKGITYDGVQDGRCFVIFNDKDVKVLRKKFDELGRKLFMFVGTGAANIGALPQGFQDRIAKAQSMMAEGKSDDEVFAETHLHIAPDGKLRVQISDTEAQLTEDSDSVLQWRTDKYGKKRLKSTQCRLEDIFDHELLYELYPGLRSLPVRIRGTSTYASGLGSYINLSTTETKSRVRQSILHEVQHIIQSYENFARGGKSSYPRTTNENFAKRNTLILKVTPKLVDNKVITYWAASEGGDTTSTMYNRLGSPDEMRALIGSPALQELMAKDEELAKDIEEIKALNKKLEGLDSRLAAIKYFRLFGEAEARLTERLSFMTQEQLDTKNPYDYFDVTKFIVKDRNDYVVAHVEAPQNKQKTGEFNVVFDAETGRSIIDGSLVEAGRTTARNGKYDIRLAPEANAVTFAHELFHVFALEIQRVYNEGTITDYWKKQAEKMFKLAGAEPMVDPVDPTVARYFLTDTEEEHLANMFTTYIMKGKIENYEVRGLLAKLIDLFKKTYTQLDGAGLTPMALDSAAYSFFNTVMSTQDAIEEIQRNAGLLEILPPEGVDRELYDYYIANLAVSKVEASNDLRKKWYAIDTFKGTAEYTKKMQELKDQAKAELLEEDKYKVLAQASLFDGEGKAEQTLMWAEKNIPEANYTLGDITEILEKTPSLEEASTKIAEQEMDKYLAKRFNLTPQDIGFKEERNRAKVRALLAESVMRRGGTIADMDAEIRKADAASDKHLAKTSVYQIIDLNKWKNREAAAVERYAWARGENRDDLMSAERYNQAVLNLIMIKSNGFKSEYQRLSALFEKLQTRQKKYRRKDERGNEYGELEHRYHAQDWELLRSISENFGNKIRDGRRSTKTVHEQLKDWIDTQVENRFTTVASLEQFMPFIDRGFDGSIGAMKGKDFKKLWAVMHTIDSIAMREQQLYLDGQYEDMNRYVQQTLDFYSKMNIDTEGKTMFGTSGKYFGRYGTWTNPEPMIRAIFPTEVVNKIFLPMFNGAVTSEAVAKKWIKDWREAKMKINTSNEVFVLDDGSQITYGETAKKTMTYGDVANLLIAMGAEHSYENYRLKFGLSPDMVTEIASQAIKRNPAYVNFMNETWRVYGEATEKLNDSFQERTNELFVRKEHRAFEVNGIKFEGGYVPEDKHYLALVRELGTWNQGIHNKVESKNEKLITKLADGDILSIIDITETKLSQSAKWAYAAIPYNNVKKFVERKEVNNTIGERAFTFIRDWLQNWDTPHIDESGVWRPLTRVTTIAALGSRASTALLQLSGLVQSLTHLGGVYLARGMLQFVRENGFFHPFKGMVDKSLYMRMRVENPFEARFGTESQGRTFKEIFDSYNKKTKLGKIGAGILSAYQTVAMCGIQIIDGWVATITWNGAYAKARDNGMTEDEARLEADSVVRVTQSDAMQISRSSAMQEPWARAVTAFGTWTMAMRSQVEALSSSKHYRKDMAMWLVSYAVLSSFIEAFLKEMVEPADEGEEDKEMLERILDSWYNKIVEAVGTQAMPFAGIGAGAAKALAAGLANTEDDKIFKVYSGGTVPALQYAYRAAEAARHALLYMTTGEEKERNKALIESSGLVSYEIRKYVKKALED